jgi:NAD dependent epimerase/dehydratase family enzyme
MDIAITGARGLIGTALGRSLQQDGHRVVRLVRGGATGPDAVAWDPAAGTIDTAGLEGVDAVVHLAGEGIAEKRWTPEQKDRIRRSRTDGTTLLATTLAGLDRQPPVVRSAARPHPPQPRGRHQPARRSARRPREAAIGAAERFGHRHLRRSW